eukprot:2638197-Amphidinium_carterae.1
MQQLQGKHAGLCACALQTNTPFQKLSIAILEERKPPHPYPSPAHAHMRLAHPQRRHLTRCHSQLLDIVR